MAALKDVMSSFYQHVWASLVRVRFLSDKGWCVHHKWGVANLRLLCCGFVWRKWVIAQCH